MIDFATFEGFFNYVGSLIFSIYNDIQVRFADGRTFTYLQYLFACGVFDICWKKFFYVDDK